MAKFSLSNPGAKEYLIVGGVAIGVFALYKWWSNRNAAASSSTNPSSGTTAPASPTGLTTGDLLAWISDHSSTTTTTTGSSSTPGTTSGGTNKEITLQKARSLSSLASEYGVSVSTLKGLNPHLGNRVPAGTKVRVPQSVAAARRG